MEVTGKQAIVTGAGSGIGRGIALALAKRKIGGIVIADIDLGSASKVAAELQASGTTAYAFAGDVRDPAASDELADYSWSKLGAPQILFNNAGVVVSGPSFEQTDADIRWQFEVNVFGVMNGCRSFGRRFLEADQPAWICNTASHNGIGVPLPGISHYVATKHAVIGYTDALRREYSPQIGFSVLCPGVVITDVWNSGRNRPSEFGGPVRGKSNERDFQNEWGVTAEYAGELTVAGVQNGEFFIWTNPFDIEMVEGRRDEAQASVGRQWPDGAQAMHKRIPSST